MGDINCTFDCENETGVDLEVSYKNIDHGDDPDIKVNPVLPYNPSYGSCLFATATSDGAGCHGNIYLTLTNAGAGVFEFTYDNPVVDAASTPKSSAPSGYGIAVSLKDDKWSVRCYELSDRNTADLKVITETGFRQ